MDFKKAHNDNDNNNNNNNNDNNNFFKINNIYFA